MGWANLLMKPSRECPTSVLFDKLHCMSHSVQQSSPNWARRTEKVQQRAQTGWGTVLLFILKPFNCLDFPWHVALLFYCEEENMNNWEIMSNSVTAVEGVRLTKQMLVSGTMSESETTSSFPDMLAELSKGSSTFKLQGITVIKKMQGNQIKKRLKFSQLYL